MNNILSFLRSHQLLIYILIGLAFISTLIIFKSFSLHRSLSPFRKSASASSIPSRFLILPITLTAYSPSKAQTDANPFETASGRIMTPVDLEKQLFAAASRDLLSKFTQGAPLKYGSKIYLEITIIDTMHARWTNRIDLFVRNEKIAKLIGIQPNRNIIILKEQ